MTTILDYDITSAFNQSAACDYCHKRKMRCDRQKPQCLECLKRSIPCQYGIRLKRGPKAKKQKVIEKPTSRLQKVNKSDSQVQALLFELEFNKKMVEIWKSVSLNGNFANAKRCRPKFSPATEEFIRSPEAVQTIMDEFQATFRLVFYLPTYAANMDFATKIWQALIDISASDLLTMLSTFDSTLLASILEYYIAFMLCLKLSKYDDIAEYVARITNYLFDTLIYAREDYLSSYDLTEKLLADLAFSAHYYKLTKNNDAMTVNAYTSVEMYKEAKKKWKTSKDLDAKMVCRMIMAAKTDEDRRVYTELIKQFSSSELPAQILFMANVSITIDLLHAQQKDLGDANVAIQKASYFAKAFILQSNVSEQGPVERYYDSWTGVVHSEVAIRSGDIELSRIKIGRLLEAYSVMTAPLQRLLISNIEYFEYSMNDHKLLIKDFLPMLHNQGVTMTRTLPYAMLLSTTYQQTSDSDETSNSSNELSSPSNVDPHMGSSSEEVVAVSELVYDVGADPFFEFNDFDADSNLIFNM